MNENSVVEAMHCRVILFTRAMARQHADGRNKPWAVDHNWWYWTRWTAFSRPYPAEKGPPAGTDPHRSALTDKITGLDVSADDYLVSLLRWAARPYPRPAAFA